MEFAEVISKIDSLSKIEQPYVTNIRSWNDGSFLIEVCQNIPTKGPEVQIIQKGRGDDINIALKSFGESGISCFVEGEPGYEY